MAGIGLLLNPRAKRHLKDPSLAGRLARQLEGEGVVRSARTLDELSEVVEDFKKLGIELVAVAGGDGTNHVTISGLAQIYTGAKLPYFAMLRGGTMNTIANSFDIARASPEKLLARYRRAYARRAVKPLRFVEPNVLQVGHRYGFIFGTGAIFGFISEYNRREERSPWWAAQVLGRAITANIVGSSSATRVTQRWEGEVRFDDGSAFPQGDYFTVGASTCAQIGLGFQPFYRSGELPDRFHILGIHCSPGSFVARLPRIWRGKTLGGEHTYEKLTELAVLSGKNGRVPYTLDGDVYEHIGDLEVRCGPRIRIVIP